MRARPSVCVNRLKPRNAGVEFGADAERRDVDRVHHEVVLVRAVPRRRRRAEVTGEASVVAKMEGSRWQALTGLVTGAGRQTGDAAGKVDDGPVPEPACRRRVGVVHSHSKALRALGEAAPREGGRHVLSAGTKDPASLRRRQLLAVLDVIARQAEPRHLRKIGVRITTYSRTSSAPAYKKDLSSVMERYGRR